MRQVQRRLTAQAVGEEWQSGDADKRSESQPGNGFSALQDVLRLIPALLTPVCVSARPANWPAFSPELLEQPRSTSFRPAALHEPNIHDRLFRLVLPV